MQATFCPTCGETRWQLMTLRVERATACSACGTELQTERRLPGRKATAQPPGERRFGAGHPADAATTPPTAPA